MDEVNSLPYLDSVIRETLRIHAPVPATMRVAVKDDIVPLGTPFVDKKGKVHNSILWVQQSSYLNWFNMMEWFVLCSVRKGQTMFIPILPINRSEALWGPDAREFKYVHFVFLLKLLIVHGWNRPERWESSPEAAGAVPGVWGNMLTFLGGPRACIGYRFSLVEYVFLPENSQNLLMVYVGWKCSCSHLCEHLNSNSLFLSVRLERRALLCRGLSWSMTQKQEVRCRCCSSYMNV